MTEEELLQLIEKYKKVSIQFEPEDEEKSMVCERFAGFLKDYPHHSGLSDSDTKENLWENFKEAEAEVGNYWEGAFPEGVDEDEITDWLTDD
jgi:hypothetical protein